jgi:5-methylcytosine rRNA methyltransferase NSUN4
MIACYREQYGDETEALFAAMIAPQKKIALVNQFVPANLFGAQALSFGAQFVSIEKDTLPTSIEGLLSHYFLDLSSIFAPLFLPIASHMRVLDMCSAPGGKLLVMLMRLIPDVFYVANDLSSARCQRLRRVIKSYVPNEIAHRSIHVTNKDAVSFALREPESFDAVLLDAPCSGEGHVVLSEKLLKQFKVQKSLPQRQYSLLSAALLAVKPGGHVMYATCSINRHENEGVIKKAVARKKTRCEVVNLETPFGLANEWGVTILPHLHGAGPAFFSLLRRL